MVLVIVVLLVVHYIFGLFDGYSLLLLFGRWFISLCFLGLGLT